MILYKTDFRGVTFLKVAPFFYIHKLYFIYAKSKLN